MIETIGYNRNNKSRQIDDFYSTPIEEVINILNFENLVGNVYDPCVGHGNILNGVRLKYPNIQTFGSDIIDYGFGYPINDFINGGWNLNINVDNIITNPPFKLMNEFIKKSVDIANNKVIILGNYKLLNQLIDLMKFIGLIHQKEFMFI